MPKTFVPVWHFPDPKTSWDKRLPQVVHRLTSDYGMPLNLTPSAIFQGHLAIEVPKHHARRAEDIISTNFSRY